MLSSEIIENKINTEITENKIEQSASTENTVSNEVPKKRGRGRPRKSEQGLQVQHKKLNVGFVPDVGDKSPPPLSTIESNIPSIDYNAVANGLVTTIDVMLNLISAISKGKLEYEKLTEHEKRICSSALEQEKPVLEFMAKSQGMNHIIVLATFAGVFAPKLKFKKAEKTEKKENKKVVELTEKSESKNIVTEIPAEKIEFLKTEESKNETPM